jgi:hypothetical protein
MLGFFYRKRPFRFRIAIFKIAAAEIFDRFGFEDLKSELFLSRHAVVLLIVSSDVNFNREMLCAIWGWSAALPGGPIYDLGKRLRGER